ncbi:hypothetical protein; putative exported protein [Xenorhabdus nematophila AN6/1]|nr:hypothetical protein; putative exported protein [Xenorhabdus nematophila str. Anatoliense]CEE95900.1 hypothetical protein; putative exported protein [Xenorhabdus nematophila str. Anatoliense]CEF31960.1 hypothetical protein; putative exported protein [Xenorhabdus nematophila str. Websteri]CEF33857.1 hypothetical protein; putative exported protein [Xenorhabdus nematophila str. Websteri]CEK22820.1 hypothetical protein; putative exported protein [Xenorhabdus nematophila AN6/1]
MKKLSSISSIFQIAALLAALQIENLWGIDSVQIQTVTI